MRIDSVYVRIDNYIYPCLHIFLKLHIFWDTHTHKHTVLSKIVEPVYFWISLQKVNQYKAFLINKTNIVID